jgi:polysaccharide export outer membrane protein
MNALKITTLTLGAVVFLMSAAVKPSFSAAATGASETSVSNTPGTDATASAPYILSPDDQLNITILGHTDLTFNYPVVGTVHAAGLTVDQLTNKLTEGLSVNLNKPRLTVSVVQSRPRKVSIVGEVKNPGLYDVKPGWRVLDAVAASGGLSHVPEVTEATLISDSGKKVTKVDVVKLLTGADMTQNLPLSSGDLLMFQVRDPSVALVQVTGEVVKPGQYVVPAADGAPLLSILTQAGGPTPDAALSRVQVMHGSQVKTVNVRNVMDDLNDSTDNVRLVPGDVLLIPTNKNKIAILGEVKNPSVQVIPDGETLTVASALSLAGGPTSDGDSTKINVVQNNPGGKPLIKEVNLTNGLNGDTNLYALKPGDVIYVPTRRKGHGIGESGGLLYALATVANKLF